MLRLNEAYMCGGFGLEICLPVWGMSGKVLASHIHVRMERKMDGYWRCHLRVERTNGSKSEEGEEEENDGTGVGGSSKFNSYASEWKW